MINQETFKKWSKIGLIGVAALIVAPIIFMVVKGIIGLAIAAVVGGLIISLSPAVAQTLTTVKFKALKGVIDHAPVEALHQRAKERWDELSTQRELLKQQASSLEDFKRKCIKFIKDYPEERQEHEERLTNYENIFAMRVEMFKKAKADTELFDKQVDKAEAIYEMAVADQQLGKSFGKGKDFMTIFKERTAFEAIEKANSQSMADLKMALLDEDFVTTKIKESSVPSRQVSYTPTNTVNLGSILDMPVKELAQ